MDKIRRKVAEWRDYLHTPTENDVYRGASDDVFDDKYYLDDDANEFRSVSYKSELDSFLKQDNPDIAAHDMALEEIDRLFYSEGDESEAESESNDNQRVFAEGYNVTRIESAKEFRKLIESLQEEALAGGGISWVNPDPDLDNIDEIFQSQPQQQDWMEWIDDLRNGRFGELPEDFDGLQE